jgi:hypothetical protein
MLEQDAVSYSKRRYVKIQSVGSGLNVALVRELQGATFVSKWTLC